MTIVDAIKSVMHSLGRPLTAREAYAEIIAKSLYTFHAKNPQHVVLMQIRRHCIGIDFPSASPTKHFKLHNNNTFSPIHSATFSQKETSKPQHSPTEDPASSLQEAEQKLWAQHKEYLQLFKLNMLAELKKLSPTEFELFARELMEAYGFEETMVTKVSGDGGIDGHGKLKVGLAHLNVAFQCKRWTKGKIQRPEIDKFRGASQGKYEQGIFFTTSSFSTGSIEVSIQNGAIPIVLLDGPAIVDLMIEKNFRVESNNVEIPTFAL